MTISVGVRDLKNQLSQYLQYVKHGETVVVTEHNRIIAEITLPKEDKVMPSVEEKLELLAVSGKIIKAKRNKSVSGSNVNLNDIDWISIYQKEREDR